MTFSIAARCAETGQFGVAVSSSSAAVAARCAHTRANVGAVASQNITDPELGPRILDALENGLSAQAALDDALRDYQFKQFRQVLIVDAQGTLASHSGANILGLWSEARGKDCIAAGNLLAVKHVPDAMVSAFERTEGTLAHRIMSALEAGLDAGGEMGPVYSAGLKVSDQLSWPFVDLRVDWSQTPISELRKVLAVYEPQAKDYVQRAISPSAAPSFGVPGDR